MLRLYREKNRMFETTRPMKLIMPPERMPYYESFTLNAI